MRRVRWQQSAFTLLEILIAMTILSIIVLILLYFVAATQRLWQIADSNNRIYENSRIAFEIIERDMRSSLTSSITDKQIGFYINPSYDPTSVANCLLCTFVSSSELMDSAKSRLSEISYKLQTVQATSDSTTPAAYTFGRQMTCDDDAANWNFCGRPANWFTNTAAAFEPVIGGVQTLTFNYYDNSDTPILSANNNIDALGNLTIPYRVEINLVLFDERLIDQPAAVRFRTQRSFTKILYLGDLQTN